MPSESDDESPAGHGLGTTATPVFTSTNSMEAEIVRGMLEANEIEAETWSVGLTGYGNTIATSQVMVRAADAAESKRLIDEVGEDSSG